MPGGALSCSGTPAWPSLCASRRNFAHPVAGPVPTVGLAVGLPVAVAGVPVAVGELAGVPVLVGVVVAVLVDVCVGGTGVWVGVADGDAVPVGALVGGVPVPVGVGELVGKAVPVAVAVGAGPPRRKPATMPLFPATYSVPSAPRAGLR